MRGLVGEAWRPSIKPQVTEVSLKFAQIINSECFRITWPDDSVQDLAYALRDGVLLCHLVHSIDPDTLDMRQVNQRPSLAQFLCLKNIRLFLSTLTRSFEMSETDLFQPSMLYDYSDFAQVCFIKFF